MESDVSKILLPLDAKLELLGYDKEYGSDNPSKIIDLLINEVFALRGARDEAQTRSQRSAKELESAMNKVRLPVQLQAIHEVVYKYPIQIF
jgi:hypothetical protein